MASCRSACREFLSPLNKAFFHERGTGCDRVVCQLLRSQNPVTENKKLPFGSEDHWQSHLATRVVTKINGHRDKRPSNLSNLNSVKYKIAQIK